MIFLIGTLILLLAFLLAIFNFIINESVLTTLNIISIGVILILPLYSGGRILLEDWWIKDNFKKQYKAIWDSFNESYLKWKWILLFFSFLYLTWYGRIYNP
jgi:hypothetical protein